MNAKSIIAVAVVVVVLAVGTIFALNYTNDATPNTQNTADTTTETRAHDHSDGTHSHDTDTNQTNNTDESNTESAATITFTDEGFTPQTVTVQKGDKITVVNRSSSPVEFSSADHPTHLEQPELNMERLSPGESGTVTVTETGTWGYHDHLDESNTGTIVVTE